METEARPIRARKGEPVASPQNTYVPPNWLNSAALITQMVPAWVALVEAIVKAFKKHNPDVPVSGSAKQQAAVQFVASAAGVGTELHPAIAGVVDAEVAKNNQDGTFAH